ncbi:response regulator [Pedobacter sp. SYSU D00535]|uniref:response regulator n=1 Tax=Pedobacter sp. SYSU D00535 TaxID=2810308 RepID=UPI001A95F654|nr:response regulator [Pedobacter sp. SYSU D00535]
MKRILVCDDEQDILDIIEVILSGAGWEVVTSPNVNDILKQVDAARPSVVIMDNWIPDSGGIIATQTIKNHPDYSHIPVVYLTANSNIRELAASAGAEFYIAKPFDVDSLERIVEDALTLGASAATGKQNPRNSITSLVI